MGRTFQLVKPFGRMTVRRNVVVGRAYGSRPAKSLALAEREASEILERVGLAALAEAPTERLGLLDRKRLELARALATRPRLLLLDEIMAGLNPTEIAEAVALVRRIHANGVTVIIIEHVMQVVLGLSDRLVVLATGLKLTEGPPEKVVNDPAVVAAYLGTKDKSCWTSPL